MFREHRALSEAEFAMLNLHNQLAKSTQRLRGWT